MFRASSCPSSGATTTAVAAYGLPSELGDGSAVGRDRAGRPEVYYLSFKYSSTCFGHPHAHHQELQQLQ
jgi:hypothetical protein